MLDVRLPRLKLLGSIVMLATVILCTGCRSAPVTQRQQLLLLPEQQEIALGVSAYQEVLAKEPQSTNQTYIAMVNRVGQRIARATGRADYQWEFRVIASGQQNAFALPGGKVAVYEGILPLCMNEAGLAVVLSHEIGHALARHGGERLSQGFAVEGVRQVVGIVTRTQEQQQRDALLKAYGAATEYGVILPYSRTHESEADRIGILLMAQAGYDPQEAPRFWQRFAASRAGPLSPEFLSTHPADERRAADLARLLPEAMQLYENSPQKYGLGEILVRPR